MKCLVLSDLHYALKQWDWLFLIADQYDVVVIAGDLLDLSSAVDREVQTFITTKYLNRLQPKTNLIVCSGNHDVTGRNRCNEAAATWLNQSQKRGVYVDGDTFEIDGFLFSICAWWNGTATRDQIHEQLKRDKERVKKKWIWINHAPPNRSTVSWTGKKDGGDPILTEWLEELEPDLVFSGHIHNAPFGNKGSWIDEKGSTWVFNAGRQIGPSPTHIILDTETNTAKWFSFESQEFAHLQSPVQTQGLS